MLTIGVKSRQSLVKVASPTLSIFHAKMKIVVLLFKNLQLNRPTHKFNTGQR